ncbi:MAG: S-adenosylmethionine:tRNA ribosyltransferase-isomerase, partial [Rhodospirillales bacterium]|nr:S-adenosylmethionine:tRNA ribosyltransferase-isomerase [Rhodospirillales bacterium]
MQLSEFGYDLPPERIATTPARPRDSARLLHVAADGLHNHIVRDLPALLRPDDLLVVNDTKVIPAQLTARRGEAKIGITLDRRLDDGSWHVL